MLRDEFFAASLATGSVTQVRGECRARRNGIADLRRARARMADGRHHAGLRDSLDVTRRLRPLGGERNQPYVTLRGVLPTQELGEVRRPHPWAWMLAPRAVLRRDVRALHVEGLHRLAM